MTFLTPEYKVNAFQTQRNVYSHCTVAVVFTSTGLISWGDGAEQGRIRQAPTHRMLSFGSMRCFKAKQPV